MAIRIRNFLGLPLTRSVSRYVGGDNFSPHMAFIVNISMSSLFDILLFDIKRLRYFGMSIFCSLDILR